MFIAPLNSEDFHAIEVLVLLYLLILQPLKIHNSLVNIRHLDNYFLGCEASIILVVCFEHGEYVGKGNCYSSLLCNNQLQQLVCSPLIKRSTFCWLYVSICKKTDVMKCNSKTESIPLSAVMSFRQLGQLAVFSTLVNHPVVKSISDGCKL